MTSLIDPSIILRDISPKNIEPYENALARQFKIDAARQEYDQNAFKMQQDREAVQQQNALAQFMSTNPNLNDPATQAKLYGVGGVAGAQKYLKGAADVGKVQADTQKAKNDADKIAIENHLQKFEIMERLMRSVRDQSTFDQMKQQAAAIPMLADLVPNMPAQYDPQMIADNMGKAMALKDRLAAKHQELTLAETGRHNLASEGIQIRGQDRQSADNAASRDVQMNTARMVDSRSREANDFKRQEKEDTANLTKQSQLASFDTMLGSLDRLGKHPGLTRSVGVMGALPTIPGSDSANFQAELNTFQSQAFLPMVAQLKGMGALSDAEGKKLTQAVGALDPKMGEKAFRESVARITSDMMAAKERVATNGKSSKMASNQDSEAMNWAKANPNDPRSAKILQHLGR